MEIAAGQGEMLRGSYSAELLKVMCERAEQYNVQINRREQCILLTP